MGQLNVSSYFEKKIYIGNSWQKFPKVAHNEPKLQRGKL